MIGMERIDDAGHECSCDISAVCGRRLKDGVKIVGFSTTVSSRTAVGESGCASAAPKARRPILSTYLTLTVYLIA